ncbi:MAG: hypothetical protein NW223_01910 [Hyphomicrobiaceae bacterium]|nr:hypothetical protein [Hyphomicrobiaceae bacterium]
MQISDLTLAAFLFFGSVRILSYVPQIIRVAQDHSGASAISYTTWSTWTLANLATASYAAVNLQDPYLAGVSCIYAACCALVLSMTVVKRSGHRRQHGIAEDNTDAEVKKIQDHTRRMIAVEGFRLRQGLCLSPDFERRLSMQRNQHLLASLGRWLG